MTNYSHETHQLKDFEHMYFFDYSDGNSRQVRLYPMDIVHKIDLGMMYGQIFSKKQIQEQDGFPISELENILEKNEAKILYFENLKKY